jgi:hypothetical protein
MPGVGEHGQVPVSEDWVLLRRRWDDACDRADREVRRARESATAAGETWMVEWLTIELDQLASLQATVNGRGRRPGTGGSDLFYDFPPDLQAPPYAAAMQALETVNGMFYNGLDAQAWDWSGGFPPNWPMSFKDRLRAYAAWHRT